MIASVSDTFQDQLPVSIPITALMNTQPDDIEIICYMISVLDHIIKFDLVFSRIIHLELCGYLFHEKS